MKFELVKKEQFENDFAVAFTSGNLDKVINATFSNQNLNTRLKTMANIVYESLTLPKRATIGSAGYDFFYPLELKIPEGLTVKIPTGIAWNAKGEGNYVLCIYPRSSLGIKYSLREPNIISVIDSDYYGCRQNGGHIHVFLRNEGNNGICIIKPYSAYCQGIIHNFFITEDDNTTNVRTGGIGSTSSLI